MNRPKTPHRIKTDRLLLRPYRLEDLKEVFAYACDEEWATFLPTPMPYLPCHSEQFLASQVLLDGINHASWAIVSDDTVTGGINIRFQFDHRTAEIGYSIARRAWGQGLATEAVRAVIDQAFATHADLNRIRAMRDRQSACAAIS